jgi:predicted nuclease of predicted toxin-antitoxin system
LKRRSATSSAQQRDPIVFFVDRSLGRRTVVNALRDAGAQAEAHDDHFEQDTPDRVWIPEVSRRSWVILTKDARIRRREIEINAVRSARSRVFVITIQAMKGSEAAALLVKHLARIENLSRSRRPPFWEGAGTVSTR